MYVWQGSAAHGKASLLAVEYVMVMSQSQPTSNISLQLNQKDSIMDSTSRHKDSPTVNMWAVTSHDPSYVLQKGALIPRGGNKSWQVKDSSRNHIKAIFINKA